MSNIALSQDLVTALSALNRLSSVLGEGVDVGDDQAQRIVNALNQIEGITSIISDLEDDVEFAEPANPLPEPMDKTLYSIGETCLLIDPFDNYRVFTLYRDYKDQTAPTLDVSGQKLYLVFKQNNKEIRIPEYETFSPYVKIDKMHGQVLFKINKKYATDLMTFTNRVFYITRVYETYNSTTDETVTSDEEVIYSGYWADRNRMRESNLTQTVEDLKETITQKNEIIEGLGHTITDLVNQNEEYLEQVKGLQSEFDNLQKEYDEMVEQLNDEYGGFLDSMNNANIGELVDSKSVLINYENADQETRDYLDKLSAANDYEETIRS